MRRILTSLCLALWAGLTPLWADPAENLAAALEQIRVSDWDAARASVRNDSQAARDIIEWHRLRAGLGDAQATITFLERNPNWPGLKWLRRKSEPAMASADTDARLAFYADTPPQAAEGVLSHAAALKADDHLGEAEASIVLAWRTLPMGRTVQGDFLEDHAELLAPHHVARLDRMLWDRHLVSARQMLSLVSDGQRKLAEARIALHELAPGVDTRIEAVPDALQSSPGLAHKRFEWRVRKGRTEDAIALLLERSSSAEALGEPDKWASRRCGLARQTMRTGDAAQAYRIAAQHGLTEGSDFADLEWLSGFVALRLLNDPATALTHFQRFNGAVASPISKGRAGYWTGRAHEALGDTAAARAAYAEGARHQTSFYGLLAAERGALPFDAILTTPPDLPPWRQAPFMGSSVLEAALLFLDAGALNPAERFLTHLVEGLDPVQAGQLGDMAVALGHPHLAVMIGKRAARTGTVLPGGPPPRSRRRQRTNSGSSPPSAHCTRLQDVGRCRPAVQRQVLLRSSARCQGADCRAESTSCRSQQHASGHVPFAAIARHPLHCKTNLGQRPADRAGCRIGRCCAARCGMACNLGDQARFPQFRVFGRGEPVQKPRIRLAGPARHCGACIPDNNVQRHSRAQIHHRPRRIPNRQQSVCLRLRKRRKRPRHRNLVHRIGFETGVVQCAPHATGLPCGQRGQRVQPGAKAQLGNGEPVSEPGRQIVASQKHMSRLGPAILQTEIGIVEPGRDRHAFIPPFQLRPLACHGIVP